MPLPHRNAVLKIGSILLDPKNPRIPAERRSDDQRALIRELLEHEDIRTLASSIAARGVYPHERLIVVQEGRRFVVLEGNRRVAAVKLLLNPQLAPTTAQVRSFRLLSEKADHSELGKLEAIIVDDRVAAAPIIARLHTRDPRKRWSSVQQARFYRELSDEGLAIEEIVERVQLPAGDVLAFLRAEYLHRIALGLELDKGVREKLEHSDFPLSTLRRFIESKAGRAFLGIELDGSTTSGFRGVVHADRFRAALGAVITAITTHERLTREINKEADIERFTEQLRENLPPTPATGSFKAEELVASAPAGPPTSEPLKKPTRQKERADPSILPRDLVCRSSHPRIQNVFRQLKAMPVSKFPDAVAVMLRVLFEMTVWTFIEERGLHKELIANFNKKGNKPKDWVPSQVQVLRYGLDHNFFDALTPAALKAIDSVAKDTTAFLTIETFNQWAHSAYIIPTESELRAMFVRIRPLLEYTMNWKPGPGAE